MVICLSNMRRVLASFMSIHCTVMCNVAYMTALLFYVKYLDTTDIKYLNTIDINI